MGFSDRPGVAQRITGFHQDVESHWVADLECGHSQHVRHDPPWQIRPWVTSMDQRAARIGTVLQCVLCGSAEAGDLSRRLRFASAAPDTDLSPMTERRFNEAEVAAIFERAAEAQQTPQRQLPSGEGMTLTELQEIGREVGISPEQVVQAAKAIELAGRPTARQFLGLQVGVGRTIDLERKLSDEEWERFVVDLRETFDARGTLKHEGSLRQWTNGNLQALLEPTATGHRIRLRTIKGDARGLMIGGLATLGLGTMVLIDAALRVGGADLGMLASQGVLAIMGAGMFAVGALRVPGWARLRRRQMEEVAARIAVVASSPLAHKPGNQG